MIQIGIDSFAANNSDTPNERINMQAMDELLTQIEFADVQGIELYGIGEHHRKEYMDAAPPVILAAAAARTKTIRLTSAVTVLSAADPVRVFQQHATLDIISKGRAEMIVGRGSFSESFPLFGFSFNDYDDLYAEKLDLLLAIRSNETLTWHGKFRPPLHNQSVYPRPIQPELPIWVGVGGTPESCIRAGTLGLPLMIAIIGGETHRFKRQVDLYNQAYLTAGHPKSTQKIGIHSLGYVAPTTEQALNDFYPGYKKVFDKIGRERGWSPVTKDHFLMQTGPLGALVVGSPDDVAQKILRHSQALGGLSRFTFQMNVAALNHDQIMQSIKLIGTEVMPRLLNH
jgi:probable LLM family oxidoreductase